MKESLKLLGHMLLLVGISLCVSCKPNSPEQTTQDEPAETESTEVLVEAENFTEASVPFAQQTLEEVVYVESGSAGWLAFDVEIAVAGRYQTQVQISNSSDDEVTCWVEDYYDNKDDRTYNITSTLVAAASSSFSTISKDGSPLNTGLHKMKLHVDGAAKIDWIKFSLIKEHDVTPTTLTQEMSGEEWKVVWSDEFDGDSVDTSKWTYDIGNWGWGNNELQYYTRGREKNARIEDGNLIIEAHKDDMGEAWTSARLTTRGKVTFLYGKIEFRAKVPPNRGNWAAGWTLGDKYVDELSWPYCGEIDILESVGYEVDDETGNGIAHASAHCGAYYFKLGNQPTATIPVENMHEEFHTYAVVWTPEGMDVLIDDQPYFTYDDTSTELSWPFDQAQNIILNLAMGGGWGGALGMDESIVSQKMIVDYVRVYERQ